MINLENLLDYQKTNIELKKINDELEKSDDIARLEQAKVEFNKAKKAVNDAEEQAEKIVAFYQNAVKYFEENNKKIEELIEKFDSCSEEEQAQIKDQLTQLKNKYSELEKKMAEKKATSDLALKVFTDAQERGRKMKSIFVSTKERIDAVRKAKEPRINEINSKKAELRSKIEPALMKQYDEQEAEGRVLAFVPLIGEKNCGGCGMELSIFTITEIKEKGMFKCETCRRIIYKS